MSGEDKQYGIFGDDFNGDEGERLELSERMVDEIMDKLVTMIDEGEIGMSPNVDQDEFSTYLQDEDRRTEFKKIVSLILRRLDPAAIYIIINVLMNVLVDGFVKEMREQGSFGDDFYDSLVDQKGAFLDGLGQNTSSETLGKDDLEEFLGGN